MDDAFAQLLVDETNNYADERIAYLRSQNKLKKHSRYQSWKPETFTEMKGFLAAVINMGVIQVPDIESYWTTNWTGEIPFFSRLFSRDRFEQIF